MLALMPIWLPSVETPFTQNGADIWGLHTQAEEYHSINNYLV